LLEEGRPLVIGHRGYAALLPENTLAAFRAAVAAGADLVELDYRHTRDGVAVVLHDSTLDRTTDAIIRWGGKDIPVDSKSADEIQQLEAGRWFDPPIEQLRVPTLAQALETIQRGSVTLIEHKAGAAAACVELLRQQNLINRVIVQSFDWEYLHRFRRLEPAQILGALGPPDSWEGRKLSNGEKELSVEWLDRIEPAGARIVVWNRQVNRKSVQAAHGRGWKVWVYTINDAALAERLIDLGIDGLITDNPAMAWRVLACGK
jgi:glycerophosphoryl diester phosphodiesterase